MVFPEKEILVFIFDGFSDWEISFLMPEISQHDGYRLMTFSTDGEAIRSAGGLKIIPDLSLSDLDPARIRMLVLPGGEAWEKGRFNVLLPLTKKLIDNGQPVAAICGATVFLAENGFLDNIPHTSNDPVYLKSMAPNYRGMQHYSGLPACRGVSIITASGIAPIEFAREVFSEIGLYDEANLEKWFRLFKHGIITQEE